MDALMEQQEADYATLSMKTDQIGAQLGAQGVEIGEMKANRLADNKIIEARLSTLEAKRGRGPTEEAKAKAKAKATAARDVVSLRVKLELALAEAATHAL